MTDLNELLMPISEKNKCGEYLKYDYVYDQIKELRREDDPRLSQGVWKTEPKKANWLEVERLCSNLLREKTKDLQIAIWLLESWTVTKRLGGFNQGVSLILALCEKFWDDIHPLIDMENNNFISRLSPLYFLAEKIQEKVVLIPLVESMDGLSGSYSLSDWMTAQHNFQTKNAKGLSFKQLKKSILSTSIEFFQVLETEVELSTENLKKLNDFVDQKCSSDSPNFRGIFDCLSEIKRITSKNLQEKYFQMQENSTTSHVKHDDVEVIDKNLSSGKTTLPQATIEQAYAALDEVAIFLEKAQPQSPAAPLIKIASALGKKNFQELLEINIKSGTSIMTTISDLYRVINTPDKNVT
ncbi:MAG: type VI secretion system protein TssA [Holosporaceae bacterium]|jgi:type VI secretion system protein ImpA|nr:type VI secretion system protein TssA [Holosporaceae bacterium]